MRFALLFLALVGAIVAPGAAASPGGPDESFGDGGIALIDLGPGLEEVGFSDPEARPDGGVDVTYAADSAERERRHYGADGGPEGSSPPPGPKPRLRVGLDDGKALEVRGGSNERVTRVEPDGSKDASFGAGGDSEEVPFGIETLAVAPSGKFFVTGYLPTQHHVSPVFGLIARFNADGSLDHAFGSEGVQYFNPELGVEGVPVGSNPQEGGNVAVALVSDVRGSMLVRLNPEGGIDRSFGGDGVVETDGRAIALRSLADGRMLVVGESDIRIGCCERQTELSFARFGADGEPDRSFDGDGETHVDLGLKRSRVPLRWGDDGSLLIGGAAIRSSEACLALGYCDEVPALARVAPDGRLDPGFGDGGTVGLEAVGEATGGGSVRSAVPRDGGYFVVGGSKGVAFLAAITPDGDLDESFASNGYVTASQPRRGGVRALAVAADDAGRTVVGGSSSVGDAGSLSSSGVLFRVDRDGGLDPAFGERDGYQRLPFEPRDLIVDDRGRAVAIGKSVVARLRPDGEADESFDLEGFAVPGRELDTKPILNSVTALPGGSLLVGGVWRDGAVVFRLRPDGRLDRSFARDGVARLGFGRGRSCRVVDLAVQAGERIVLAGRCRGPERQRRGGGKFRPVRVAVGRLLSSGQPDPSFGWRGRMLPRVGPRSRASGVAVRGRGLLVAARRQWGKRKVDLLLRLRPDGWLHPRFGRRGVARVPLKVLDGKTMPHEELQVFSTGRRILLVRAGRGWPVLAFRHDGSREADFARGVPLAPGRDFDRSERQAPVAAMRGSDLVLAWSTWRESERWGGRSHRVGLQRLLTR